MGSVLVIGQMKKQTTLSTLFLLESIAVGCVLPAFVVPGREYGPGGGGVVWSPTPRKQIDRQV